MKSPLLYLVEVLFCSGLFMAFYRLLLVRRISFRACRYYLVAAVVLSAVLPALEIPVYPARTVVYTQPLVQSPDEPLGVDLRPETLAGVPQAVVAPAARIVDWPSLLVRTVAGGYLATVLVLAGLFAVRIVAIRRLRRCSQLTDCGGYTLAEHRSVGTPFSFLRTIYLGEGFEGRRRAIVLCHEASHIRHRHSVERIAVEVVRSLFWFNPFVWMAQRWLAEVQEWEADRDVLDAGYGLTEYRTVIFRQLFGYNPDIACGLNHSLTKKRFVMMTQFRKRRFAFVRIGAALPVVAGMMMLCSFTTKSVEAGGRPGHRSEIRITADGIWMNGELRSKEEIVNFVAEERSKLSEAERTDWTICLKADLPERSASDSGTVSTAVPMITISSDGAIALDGREMSLGELETNLGNYRASLSDAEVRETTIRISVDERTPMGIVTDVKQVLRRVSLLKVAYENGAERISRILPPMPGTFGDVSVVLPDESHGVKIDNRNFFHSFVNAEGRILAGPYGHLSESSVDALAARVKDFLLNESGDPAMSEREKREFALPDGRKVTWPVSSGVVSVQIARDAPFRVFLRMQEALAKAFDGIRTDLAQQWFGRSVDALTEAERAVVLRAVPVKIFEAESH